MGEPQIVEPLSPREREDEKKRITAQVTKVYDALKVAKNKRLTNQIPPLESEIKRLEDSLKIVEQGYAPYNQETAYEKIALEFYNKPMPPEIIIRLGELKDSFQHYELLVGPGEILLMGRWGDSRAKLASW
ncbi:MAG: hypothetical protein HY558_08090 [Euryarchaeota archaeon]|nr:hypothetical protein [Euryarchaeota archaeon]